MSETPPPTEGSPTPPEGTPPEITPGASAPQGSAPLPGSDAGDPVDVEKNKVFALLSYIGILVLVPILAAKESPFAKYHANQGLVLFLIEIAVCVVLGCGGLIAGHVPVIGPFAGCIGCVVWAVVWLAFVAYAILGIVNAVNGKMKPLPGFPAITLIK